MPELIDLKAKLRNNSCSEDDNILDLGNIWDLPTQTLASAMQLLRSGLCLDGLWVRLTRAVKLTESIAQVLASGQCPAKLALELGYGILDNDGFALFAQALKSGRCPTGLSLDFSSYNKEYDIKITTQMCESIVGALKSGRCPQDLTLDFSDCDLEDGVSELFSEALASGACSKNLSLRFNNTLINIAPFLAAIDSGQCPEGLKLAFGEIISWNEEIESLASTISSGRCPRNFTLDFSRNPLTDQQASLLSQALQSGKCPDGLHLAFSNADASTVEALVEHFATALQSGKCPPGLTLDISHNKLPLDKFRRLLTALESGQCPHHLTLDFTKTQLTTRHIEYLANTLSSGKCPPGLSLNLSGNQLTKDDAELLKEVLRCGQCPDNLSLDLSDNEFCLLAGKHVAAAIGSSNCPEGLTLKLNGNHLGAIGHGYLAQAMGANTKSNSLTLKVDASAMPEESIKKYLKALKRNKKGSIDFSDTLPTKYRHDLFKLFWTNQLSANSLKANINLNYFAITQFQSHLKVIRQYHPSWFGRPITADSAPPSNGEFSEAYAALMHDYQQFMHLFPENHCSFQPIIKCVVNYAELLFANYNNDEASLNDYYEDLQTWVLPALLTWQQHLEHVPHQRWLFAETCQRIAMCYLTDKEARCLQQAKKENATSDETTLRETAERSLAMRAQLLKLAEKYGVETTVYHQTMANLTTSLAGQLVTFPPTSWEETQKAPTFSATKTCVDKCWQETISAANAIINSDKTMIEQLETSADTNMKRARPEEMIDNENSAKRVRTSSTLFATVPSESTKETGQDISSDHQDKKAKNTLFKTAV